MGAQGGKAADPAATASTAEPDLALSIKSPVADAAPGTAAPAASSSSPATRPDAANPPDVGASAPAAADAAAPAAEASSKEKDRPPAPVAFVSVDQLLTDCVSSWGKFAGLSEEELATTTGKGLVDGPVISSMTGATPKEEAVVSDATKADAVLEAFYKFGVSYKHYRFEALKAREKSGGAPHGFTKVIAEGNETIKEITEVKLRREGQGDKLMDSDRVHIEKRSNMVTISFEEKTTIDSYTIKTGEGDPMYDPVRWRFMGANSINGPWSCLHAMEMDYDTPMERRKFLTQKIPPVKEGEKEPIIDPDDLVEWFYVTDLAATSGVDFDANLDGFFSKTITNGLEEYEGSDHKALIEKGFEKKMRETRVQRTVGTGKHADRNFETESPQVWSHEDELLKKYRTWYERNHRDEIFALGHKQKELREDLHKNRVVARDVDKVQGKDADSSEQIAASAASAELPLDSDWAKANYGWLEKSKSLGKQDWPKES